MSAVLSRPFSRDTEFCFQSSNFHKTRGSNRVGELGVTSTPKGTRSLTLYRSPACSGIWLATHTQITSLVHGRQVNKHEWHPGVSPSQTRMALEDWQESRRSCLMRTGTPVWLAPCPGLHSTSRGSSPPRDQTQVFCITGRFFYHPSHHGRPSEVRGESFSQKAQQASPHSLA